MDTPTMIATILTGICLMIIIYLIRLKRHQFRLNQLAGSRVRSIRQMMRQLGDDITKTMSQYGKGVKW